MSTAIEKTNFSEVARQSGELQETHAASIAQYEIQSMITIAKNYPRNEDDCFGALMRACSRPTFAAGAEYSFPRGGEKVFGASVKLAREAARLWRNIRYSMDIIRDDKLHRTVKGWAWDVETNVRVEIGDSFSKLIQRKNKKTGETEWVEPDERDLRELTNRRGAICVRNCLLQLLPPDLIEDAIRVSRSSQGKEIGEDMEGARKRLIVAFGAMQIEVSDLESYLGHELRLSTPAEIADLRSVYGSLKDGQATWSDYMGKVDGDTGGTDDLAKEIANAKASPKTRTKAKPKPRKKETPQPEEKKPDATSDVLDGCHADMAIAAKNGNPIEVMAAYDSLLNRFTILKNDEEPMAKLCKDLLAEAKKNDAE